MATTTLHPTGVTGGPYVFVAKTAAVAPGIPGGRVVAQDVFIPGGVVADVYLPGVRQADVFIPGGRVGE